MENKLQLITQNNEAYINSREVAKLIGKRHDNLVRDIKHYIDVLNTSNLRSSDFFIESDYQQAGNSKTVRCFLVTKKGCDMIANKLSGEKGILFTATYVNAFEQMQKEISLMQLDSYAIPDDILRAQKWIQEKEERRRLEANVQQLTEKIKEQEPAVEFFNRTEENDNFMDISTAAKVLNIPHLGPRKLMAFLREKKDLMYKRLNGKRVNIPTQYGVDKGYYRLYSYSLKNKGKFCPRTHYKPQVSREGLKHIMRLLRGIPN